MIIYRLSQTSVHHGAQPIPPRVIGHYADLKLATASRVRCIISASRQDEWATYDDYRIDTIIVFEAPDDQNDDD